MTEQTMAATGQTGSRYRYTVLALLTVVYAFNFVDRQILGILAPYIQADLGLDDKQLGLLSGFYFALFYTVVGLPIAWLADRYNRVTIVSVSLALWSGFTAVCGLANNYVQLALARMGVGIGEAGGSPPSHSMISDLFSANERAKALGIYSLGIPLGIMAAYFASAALLGEADLNWRVVFFAVGLPGVALAVVVKLVIKEPVRGATDSVSLPAEKASFGQALATLLKIPSYWAMCLGISAASFLAYGLSSFSVLYLSRQFPDFPISQLLIWLGVAHGVAYSGGTYLGGVIADRWGQKTKAGYALTPVVGLLIGLPCLLAALWSDDIVVALTLLSLYLIAIGTYLGPSFSVAQNLAPVSVRATSTAIFFFVLNMIALGGGPTLVGYLSNRFTEQTNATEALRWSLTWVSLAAVFAVVFFLWAALTLPKDWEHAEQRRNSGQ